MVLPIYEGIDDEDLKLFLTLNKDTVFLKSEQYDKFTLKPNDKTGFFTYTRAGYKIYDKVSLLEPPELQKYIDSLVQFGDFHYYIADSVAQKHGFTKKINFKFNPTVIMDDPFCTKDKLYLLHRKLVNPLFQFQK